MKKIIEEISSRSNLIVAMNDVLKASRYSTILDSSMDNYGINCEFMVDQYNKVVGITVHEFDTYCFKVNSLIEYCPIRNCILLDGSDDIKLELVSVKEGNPYTQILR